MTLTWFNKEPCPSPKDDFVASVQHSEYQPNKNIPQSPHHKTSIKPPYNLYFFMCIELAISVSPHRIVWDFQ